MLKGSENLEETSHFSYKEYKKKVKKSPNQDILIFCSVFVVALIVLLGFAKVLSPNVDVSIASDDEIQYEEVQSAEIDERLIHLQMEDEGKSVEQSEMFSPELDEKVVLPQQRQKTVGEIEAEHATLTGKDLEEAQESSTNLFKKASEEDLKPAKKEAVKEEQKTAPLPDQIVNAKVVVGSYATEKQAEVAKSIIQDAGIGVTPFVKNVGGYYTLQVGSYSSKEKAQLAANKLLKSNFPARVIVE